MIQQINNSEGPLADEEPGEPEWWNNTVKLPRALL